jgi:RNA polymerase sigma factor (sigma-70 family)
MKDSATVIRLVDRARDPAASLQEQHAAFAELVGHFQRLAFGLALASLRDVEEAKDASQDAFVMAWQRLRQLRDPAAFTPWLRTIVARTCSRRRRTRVLDSDDLELPVSAEPNDRQIDYQSLVSSALDRLPDGERDVTVLFYFLGYSLPQIAKLLRLKPGTVGKRLHSARLRIRRELPRSVRGDFVRLAQSKQFVERVSRGLLDEYTGDYRFDRRPELVVSIKRTGDCLISEAGEQRHLLVSAGKEALLVTTYDGEGRFVRNRRGEVTHFVYYEFGRRLGIARKTSARAPRNSDDQRPRI